MMEHRPRGVAAARALPFEMRRELSTTPWMLWLPNWAKANGATNLPRAVNHKGLWKPVIEPSGIVEARRRCVYAVAVCTMPRGLVSGAPFFSLFCGGDTHPTAHVWRWRRASRRICFQSGEAVFFQRWRRATCRAARPAPKPSSLVVELALASGWSICLRSCAQELGREYRRLFP